MGGSERAAVFQTVRNGSQRAVIKLVMAATSAADALHDDAQLSRWSDTSRRSHPHLIRLFENGRCQIDGTSLLYVVMEYADEDLGQILPIRSLSTGEVLEMLQPTAEALAFLHGAGFVHARIKPSNIMAVDNQLKISSDCLRQTGERADAGAGGAYDPPEGRAGGASPAADIWSLGMTLVAVLTQHEPQITDPDQGKAIAGGIQEPLRGIVRQCLRPDPQQRCSARDILTRLESKLPVAALPPEPATEKRVFAQRWKWMVAIAVAVVALAFIGSRFMFQARSTPSSERRPAEPSTVPAAVPAEKSPAPFSGKGKEPEKVKVKVKTTPGKAGGGSVLQQVLPEVSRGALNTITGHVKVVVHVAVDGSGNVSEATFKSAGPSQYFAKQAMAAARRWKFNPPQVDGQGGPSEWDIRFMFGRGSTQAFPTQIKP
jgi:TonB family protein